MQLQIPHAPRRVRLSDVPGAWRRLAIVAGLGLAIVAVLGGGAAWLSERALEEDRFLARAEEVIGRVAEVTTLRAGDRDEDAARVHVVYEYEGQARSARAVRTSAERAGQLYRGAEVLLLVDPTRPEAPREAQWARRSAVRWSRVPWVVGLGVLAAIAAVGFELRRTFRSDLEPIRHGALVWLTPDGPLPTVKREGVISAKYLRGDTRHEVRARIRPGRYPVRNGEKILAAIVPARPTWARVIDEDLARRLGWL